MTERSSAPHAATPRPARRSCGLALLLLLAAAALVVPGPAAAQYREAGSDLQVLPNRQTQLETAMEEAPWHLGKLRVSPWIGLRSIDYVRELDASGNEQDADLTVTGGAGLRAYMKLGTHAIAAAHAMPEYVWWQRESDRNAAVGHYGLGLFGWFNRLEGEVTARSVEEVSFLSSDVLVREPIRSDEAVASAQVRILGSFALYGGAIMGRTRVDSTSGLTAVDPALLLDRDGTLVRGGVRYLLRGKHGYVGAGVLSERTEFQAADAIRSNTGSSWYAETQLRGNHIDVIVQYDQHDLEADDSSFPGYRAGGGRAAVALRPGTRISSQIYALRALRYSAADVGSYVEEERVGAALGYSLGEAGLQLFYESGTDDYFGSSSRQEDVTAAGAWVDFSLRSLKFRVGGRETRFEPPGGPARTVRQVLGSAALSFGGPGEW
jgi:hypothetical protein